MKKSVVSRCFMFFLISFYIAIILYVGFAFFHIDTLESFTPAIIFVTVGFVFLYLASSFRVFKKSYLEFVIIIVSVFYSLALDVLNLYFITKLDKKWFILINLILTFIYLGVIVPVYLTSTDD